VGVWVCGCGWWCVVVVVWCVLLVFIYLTFIHSKYTYV